MKPGVTREQLSAELTRLSKELPARFGGSSNYARIIEQHSAVVEPVLDRLVGPTTRTSLWVLLGAVTVVLLIACANVANLFLVRAETRRRSLAVRRAIGASRGQLVRLQMIEAFIVALIAGGLAVILSALTLPIFLRAAPEGHSQTCFGAARSVHARCCIRSGADNGTGLWRDPFAARFVARPESPARWVPRQHRPPPSRA
jgi:hypothetical protein